MGLKATARHGNGHAPVGHAKMRRDRRRRVSGKTRQTPQKVYVLPSGEVIKVKPGSFLEATLDLVGVVKGGPTDLSYNKKYLEGLGRDSLGDR